MALPMINHPFGVVADPEYGTTQGGKNWARVRLGASARRYNDQSQQWETTASFYVQGTAWEAEADRIRNMNLAQGDQVYVDGQLVTEQWEDQNGGGKKSKTAMRIRSLRRFEKPQQNQQNQSQGGGFGGQQQSPPQQQQQQQQQGGGWNAPSNDPWSAGNNNGGWGEPGGDKPPFLVIHNFFWVKTAFFQTTFCPGQHAWASFYPERGA